MPFEADFEYAKDNLIKNPNSLKNKNGSSNFRPGAGTLSMERCFTEVLTRATSRICEEEQNVTLEELQSKTLLYPGHECKLMSLLTSSCFIGSPMQHLDHYSLRHDGFDDETV